MGEGERSMLDGVVEDMIASLSKWSWTNVDLPFGLVEKRRFALRTHQGPAHTNMVWRIKFRIKVRPVQIDIVSNATPHASVTDRLLFSTMCSSKNHFSHILSWGGKHVVWVAQLLRWVWISEDEKPECKQTSAILVSEAPLSGHIRRSWCAFWGKVCIIACLSGLFTHSLIMHVCLRLCRAIHMFVGAVRMPAWKRWTFATALVVQRTVGSPECAYVHGKKKSMPYAFVFWVKTFGRISLVQEDSYDTCIYSHTNTRK